MKNFQLKNDIHKIIDSIEEPDTLESLFYIVKNYSSQEYQPDILDNLSDSQLKRLNLSLLQKEQGKVVTHENMKNYMEQWLVQ